MFPESLHNTDRRIVQDFPGTPYRSFANSSVPDRANRIAPLAMRISVQDEARRTQRFSRRRPIADYNRPGIGECHRHRHRGWQTRYNDYRPGFRHRYRIAYTIRSGLHSVASCKCPRCTDTLVERPAQWLTFWVPQQQDALGRIAHHIGGRQNPTGSIRVPGRRDTVVEARKERGPRGWRRNTFGEVCKSSARHSARMPLQGQTRMPGTTAVSVMQVQGGPLVHDAALAIGPFNIR